MWPWSVLCAALACLAASVLVCAWLWWSGQRTARRVIERLEDSAKKAEEEGVAWKHEAASLRQRVERLEEALSALREAHTPRPGMNLTKRTVALRMHRRGERPEQVAAALGLPRAEVELLLKLHRAATDPAPVSAQ